MRVSHTMLSTWMRCPLQARFKYFDGLPTKKSSRMAFGICVHAALEQYNRNGNVDKAVELFLDIWDNPEKVNAEPEVWNRGTSHGGLREKGIVLLRDYHDKQKFEDRLVIAQEHKFLVPMGEHEIQGYVDLLEVRKSGRGKNVLRVVDYKTNSKKPYKDDLRINTQFTAYVWAAMQPEFWFGNGPGYPPIGANAQELWDTYKDMPKRGIWFHLMSCQDLDAGPREETDFMRMYRAITEIAKAVDHNVFVPDISGESCVFCDFTGPCGVEIPPQERENDDAFF